MEGHVAWMTELAVKDGELETFTELMEEMVAGTREEPQALAYEWYISDDQRSVHIFEKYADSDAAIAHVNRLVERWIRRYIACVDIKRVVIYGDPSPAAREIFDGWRAAYLGPWGGFSRFA